MWRRKKSSRQNTACNSPRFKPISIIVVSKSQRIEDRKLSVIYSCKEKSLTMMFEWSGSCAITRIYNEDIFPIIALMSKVILILIRSFFFLQHFKLHLIQWKLSTDCSEQWMLLLTRAMRSLSLSLLLLFCMYLFFKSDRIMVRISNPFKMLIIMHCFVYLKREYRADRIKWWLPLRIHGMLDKTKSNIKLSLKHRRDFNQTNILLARKKKYTRHIKAYTNGKPNNRIKSKGKLSLLFYFLVVTKKIKRR